MINKTTLTILGSGVYIPSIERSSPAYWLEANNKNILIDLGSGTMRQIVKAGKDYKDVDLIIISHLHPDHMTDITAFLQVTTHAYLRTKPLTIFAHPEVITYIKTIQKHISSLLPRPNTFDLQLIDTPTYALHGLSFETILGNHNPSSIITKIKVGNKEMVYTGDTGYDENVISFAKNCDLLLTECSYPENKTEEKHLTTKTVGMMAQKAHVKKLVVSHLNAEMDTIDVKGQISKYYKGDIVVGEDFKEITI